MTGNPDYRTFEGDSLELDQQSPFFLDHVTRYWWARDRFAQGRDVLDCACGKGYGAYILAGSAANVVAADLNSKSIATARSTFKKPNLSYIERDALDLKRLGKQFDLITAFELIEHIPPESTDLFLSGIAASLRPGGMFLVSTPNHDVVTKSGVFVPDFHINNFKPARLRSALRRHFDEVEMTGQFRARHGVGALVFDLDFLNLRHLVARHLAGLRGRASGAGVAAGAPSGEAVARSEFFDRPPQGGESYRFSARHWRQAGLTVAICRKPC